MYPDFFWAGNHLHSIKLLKKIFVWTGVYARFHEQNGQEGEGVQHLYSANLIFNLNMIENLTWKLYCVQYKIFQNLPTCFERVPQLKDVRIPTDQPGNCDLRKTLNSQPQHKLSDQPAQIWSHPALNSLWRFSSVFAFCSAPHLSAYQFSMFHFPSTENFLLVHLFPRFPIGSARPSLFYFTVPLSLSGGGHQIILEKTLTKFNLNIIAKK